MSTGRYIYPDTPRVSGYIGIRAEHWDWGIVADLEDISDADDEGED